MKIVNYKNTARPQDVKIELGQQFPLTIKRLGINGEGVGYFKKKVVFVDGALPEEEVVVEVTNVHPKFTEAKIRKIRKPSKYRVAAPCPVYDECGGCQLQHVSYEGQLEMKRDIVVQSLERYVGKDTDIEVKPTIGMKNPWNYRNKSQFQVKQGDSKVIAGLYSPNSHKLVEINDCLVQHRLTTEATNVVKGLLNRHKVSIYNEKKRTGLVRTIVARVGIQTNELQVVLITTQKEFPNINVIVEQMKEALPQLKSVVLNVNASKTSVVFGDKSFTLDGQDYIEEKLGDFEFKLSARTFFQLNPEQTVVLYDEVKKAAALTGTEKVADAYCGVGTIGLWVADKAKEIRGMDIIPESIEDAKKNAKAHGITHATYTVGKAEDYLAKWARNNWVPDVVIVDPPRTGLDYSLVETFLKVKPTRIVYVSCNPSTLAKDLDELSSVYKVNSIQPIDMFPQTSHVECITVLELK